MMDVIDWKGEALTWMDRTQAAEEEAARYAAHAAELERVLRMVDSYFDYDYQINICWWCKAGSTAWKGLIHAPDCPRQKVLGEP